MADGGVELSCTFRRFNHTCARPNRINSYAAYRSSIKIQMDRSYFFKCKENDNNERVISDRMSTRCAREMQNKIRLDSPVVIYICSHISIY